jgi:hypothetical protein
MDGHTLLTHVVPVVFVVAGFDLGISFLWRAVRESGD